MQSDVAWLPLRDSFLLGLTPLLYDTSVFQNIAENRHASRSFKLIINVSGVHFELCSSIVEKFPNTLLGSTERDYFYDEESGEYFFDRDPELFRYILSYYQQGKLHFPKSVCPCAFEEELKFFEILPDNLSNCCYEEYLDRRRDITDRDTESVAKRGHANEVSETLNFRKRLRNVFDDPAYNDLAQVVYYTTGFFIILSVLANMAETIQYFSPVPGQKGKTYGEMYENVFFCLDTACVVIFTMEYIARLYAADNRLLYMRSIMAIIDLVAILPYYVSLFVSGNKHFSGSLVTLRVFRVFRIFKFSRHSQGLRILGFTLQSCAQELGFLLFSLTLVVIIFATVIYYIEKFDSESSFYSIPSSAWYTIVTMTTLGYGDMVPSTVLGKIVGSVCSLCGVLVIALPVPVIVSNFSRIYQQNQRIERTAIRRRTQLLRLMKQQAINKLNTNPNEPPTSGQSLPQNRLSTRKNSSNSTSRHLGSLHSLRWKYSWRNSLEHRRSHFSFKH